MERWWLAVLSLTVLAGCSSGGGGGAVCTDAGPCGLGGQAGIGASGGFGGTGASGGFGGTGAVGGEAGMGGVETGGSGGVSTGGSAGSETGGDGGGGCASSGVSCASTSECCAGLSCVSGTCKSLPNCLPSEVVVSEVYGGGGSVSGSSYADDFVVLHNKSESPVSVDGWSLQYASASGVSWQVAPLAGTIVAGGYYLVELVGAGGGTGSALPPPDAVASISISQSSGKVALVKSTTPLASACPIPASDVADFVGYGSANCSEGSQPAPMPSTTTSVKRAAACNDSDVNGSDFTSATPDPKSSVSAASSCNCAG